MKNDGFTGAGFRMFLECSLSRTLTKNTGEVFGMIYRDMENFKDINDRYGHLAGDAALIIGGAGVEAALGAASAPVGESVERTLARGTPRRFGVDFEGALPAYMDKVREIFK